jgi:hypothetical protein
MIVWVISPDNGCEGLSEPIRAYLVKDEADDAMELLAHSFRSFKLTGVPLRDAGRDAPGCPPNPDPHKPSNARR